jgi:hypothetical protein
MMHINKIKKERKEMKREENMHPATNNWTAKKNQLK